MQLFYFTFYIFAMFPILFESMCIYSPRKVLRKYDEVKGKDAKSLPKRDLYFMCYCAGYIFWTFIGLFSSQWFLFILLMLLGVLSGILRKVFDVVYVGWFIFDSIISLVILLLIILNRYHLHVTFHDLISS